MKTSSKNLNDRLTAISDQNKCSQQITTDSLSVITNDVSSLKSGLDRKANIILSKFDSLIEKVKQTVDLDINLPTGDDTIEKPKRSNTTKGKNDKNEQAMTTEINTSVADKNMTIGTPNQTHQNEKQQPQNKQTTKSPPKRDLTFMY